MSSVHRARFAKFVRLWEDLIRLWPRLCTKTDTATCFTKSEGQHVARNHMRLWADVNGDVSRSLPRLVQSRPNLPV